VLSEQSSLPSATNSTMTRATAARHERCSFAYSAWDKNAQSVNEGV